MEEREEHDDWGGKSREGEIRYRGKLVYGGGEP